MGSQCQDWRAYSKVIEGKLHLDQTAQNGKERGKWSEIKRIVLLTPKRGKWISKLHLHWLMWFIISSKTCEIEVLRLRHPRPLPVFIVPLCRFGKDTLSPEPAQPKPESPAWYVELAEFLPLGPSTTLCRPQTSYQPAVACGPHYFENKGSHSALSPLALKEFSAYFYKPGVHIYWLWKNTCFFSHRQNCQKEKTSMS